MPLILCLSLYPPNIMSYVTECVGIDDDDCNGGGHCNMTTSICDCYPGYTQSGYYCEGTYSAACQVYYMYIHHVPLKNNQSKPTYLYIVVWILHIYCIHVYGCPDYQYQLPIYISGRLLHIPYKYCIYMCTSFYFDIYCTMYTYIHSWFHPTHKHSIVKANGVCQHYYCV